MSKQRKMQKKTMTSSDTDEDDVLSSKLIKFIDKKFQEMSELFIKSINEQFKNELSSLKTSIDFCCTKIDDYEAKVKSLDCEISSLNERLKMLEYKNNLRDQWDRSCNIEISGVPTSEKENLNEIINNISQKVGYPIKKEDVVFIHRVRQWPRQTTTHKITPTHTSTANIILRLPRRDCKDALLTAARRHRTLTSADIGLPGAASRIFLNDHLTPSNKLLMKKARELKAEKQYQYLWSKNCNIFMRKSDRSHVIRISTEADLSKIA